MSKLIRLNYSFHHLTSLQKSDPLFLSELLNCNHGIDSNHMPRICCKVENVG